MKKVLVIAGPTGVGKSAFAVQLAKQFDGEIISGDSIQVYRGMDIGSGKITTQEMDGIPHHLIDILNRDVGYSVADFQKMARKIIDHCPTLPMIVGGTGLYVKACLYDYEFQTEDHEEGLIDSTLEQYDNQTLFEMLLKEDFEQSKKIHPNNRRRLLRSLTILRRSGKRQSELLANQEHCMLYDCFIVGCTREREELYNRINARVEEMFAQGLEQEVRRLLFEGTSFQDLCMHGIGYREWEAYFQKTKTLEEVKLEIQKHSRQYAKRQYTWFKNQMPVRWVDMSNKNDIDNVIKEIAEWLEKN